METNDIIDVSDSGIVVKETSIRLSDEKLKALLLRTYERSQQDASKVKFSKLYGIFLSIAGTLLLSLITSTFGPIGQISAETVNNIAWVCCIASALLGFVMLGLSVSEKTKNDTTQRDKAISEIFEQYISN